MSRGKKNPIIKQTAINGFRDQYAFLSNFVSCQITYQGIEYPTTEHAYVAAKTTDLDKRAEIALVQTPGKVKRLGRKLELRADWDEVKLSVMLELLRLKFSKDEFKQQLLATQDAKLVETNHWHDYYWGVCEGRGENHLGKLLMQVRAELNNN